MTTETMIRAFLDATGRSIYPNYSIEGLQTAGQYVLLAERSECGRYLEQHTIELLEVVAWVYGQAQP